LCVNVTSEWRVRVLVVVKDEAVWGMLTVDDSVLAIAAVSLKLNLLAVVAEATVTDANVDPRKEDDLVKLVGGINTLLDGIVWPGNGTITGGVGASDRDMDLREEELER